MLKKELYTQVTSEDIIIFNNRCTKSMTQWEDICQHCPPQYLFVWINKNWFITINKTHKHITSGMNVSAFVSETMNTGKQKWNAVLAVWNKKKATSDESTYF